MRAALDQPPALPRWPWRPHQPGELDHETIWLSVTAGSGLLGLLWLKAGLPLPICTFKALTGCPCLTCGATRSALRLLQGDLAGAFAYNPLVVTAGLAVALYNLYALLVLTGACSRRRLAPFSPRLYRGVVAGAIAAIAGNWTWVIWRGN